MLETPAPIPVDTPISTTQPSAEPTHDTTSPFNHIGGSTFIVPFGLVILLVLSSKTKKREEINHDRK